MRPLLLVCLLWAGASLAAQPSLEKDLSNIEQSLQTARQKQEALAQEAKQNSQELRKLRKDLVKIAREVQRREKLTSRSEEKLGTLKESQKEAEERLSKKEAGLKKLLTNMIDLSIIPPEAVLAMPGELRDTMLASKILVASAKGLKREADKIQAEVAELDRLQQQIASETATFTKEKQGLEDSRKSLESKIDERTKLNSKLSTDQKSLGEDIAALSKRSQDVRELISKLEEARKERQKKEPSKPRKLAKTSEGNLLFPASGQIIHGYGETSAGQKSKGLILRTRSSAQVVAPSDGEVVFTGPFRDYGTMVILRHGGGLHTLIAGFNAVDCQPGQFISKGEPIGRMGQGGELYLELRKDFQPVDPRPWFASLPSRSKKE